MPQPRRTSNALSLAVLCGCVALALAVFAWGLNAKLSLYNPQTVPSPATVAKLVAAERTGRTLASANHQIPPRGAYEAPLAAFAVLLAAPVAPRWTIVSRPPLLPQSRSPHPDLWSRPPPPETL